ncbi:serine phosphatase RsbU, regulator of sigma subunit [Beggiatoa alba B18LD]|uniref:Serine phosphatase RsbU, regulator of sigma subunit n=1 Tax=Beggiatoa alba B18LD TaxID=395493 RepID=I3CDR5_9GAMM|nr:SpoIIE family protein phosphatase [Beggiatoa alba]EIJ41758.1 serine phosphatase RsbU, regulator of sigma subunit [Beggiatoa alba B18LD]
MLTKEKLLQLNAGKYRFVIISIALFIMIDVGVLIPNFILSSQIKQDAVGINLAGRQRMLSQRMVKVLLQLEIEQLDNVRLQKILSELQDTTQLFDLTLTAFQHGQFPLSQIPLFLTISNSYHATTLTELKKTVDLFSLTLNAFDKGDTTRGGNGDIVFLPEVATPAARLAVSQAVQIWQPYYTKLQLVLTSSENINKEYLNQAIEYGLANNLILLDLMNQLTTELEYIANHKAATIQLIQIIGIILVAINFIILVFQVLHRLKKRDLALLEAHEHITELNKKLTSENLRMSMELTIASQLQQILLPKDNELENINYLDIANFMRPATEVGGDYYDILQCEQGRVVISIGDVTGHGLESGVFTIMVQAVVRTLLTQQEYNYTRFLESANKVIYDNARRMGSDKCLTFSLLDYQYRHDGNGCLRVVGQHESVILVQNGQLQLIDTIDLGFPIGLIDSVASYVQMFQLVLNPDDVVVLYTDGITEAERISNKGREQYGITRLCQCVQNVWQCTATDIKEAILADVLAFMGSNKQLDDISLIVLKQR